MVSDDIRKRWLLIVNNDPDKLSRWREAADRAAAFHITEAETYASALEALDGAGIDIMVTDLFLTRESERTENIEEAEGLRLIEKCRRRFPRSRIVAITGKSGVGTEIGARALEAGSDDFISANWKYIDTDCLLEQKLRLFDRVLLKSGGPTL